MGAINIYIYIYADKSEKHILSSALYIGDIAYRKEGRKGSKIREREGDGESRGRSRE
jgi:hypothetical protein